MRLIVLAFFYMVIAFSCTNNENNTGEKDTETGVSGNTTDVLNCYSFTNASDTIQLKLVHVGEAITGTLEYKLDGKDKNQGTIQGAMRGDVLIADYTFMSEGVQSVRQVAFKKQDNVMIEGYGDIYMDNDKARFKNTDSLQFSSTMPLKEIDCQ